MTLKVQEAILKSIFDQMQAGDDELRKQHPGMTDAEILRLYTGR
jgi:hypothetical protein